MISKVDLHDFWEITRALYGNDRTSDAEMAVVRQLLDAMFTPAVTAPGRPAPSPRR